MTGFHGTTILAVRHRDRVALGGDGQVTLGDTVVKSGAQKVRKLRDGRILAGFAGSVADGLTLFDKFEEKLERHPANLARACVELAKDWRTDRFLRRLEALLAVADAQATSSSSAVTATSSSPTTASSPSAAAAASPWPQLARSRSTRT